MKKTILILFLLVMNQAFCQKDNSEEQLPYQYKIYNKCFEDLKPIQEIENNPILKVLTFCSLAQCEMGIEYTKDQKDIQEVILKRAIEICTILYKEGTPVYLTNGLDSFYDVEQKNQNITDDNNLIYISVAACTSTSALQKFKKNVNEQTMKLINKK
ncbi:hypothetical protein GON26_18880 [Flavobacterium sp. GA093]|uniref:Uncharacterized protein n=1 Tax=Flavobacterium hydrocarbonoxydans TaxID=2683249 RepID=A0A6I4NQF9_9FLAO|nr:hypothetical protein [Flavobacterium hydrocarbonoxydans]MWB96433.1 hypothetical protein [Flavobacterium hydrocarbonoxydans]